MVRGATRCVCQRSWPACALPRPAVALLTGSPSTCTLCRVHTQKTARCLPAACARQWPGRPRTRSQRCVRMCAGGRRIQAAARVPCASWPQLLLVVVSLKLKPSGEAIAILEVGAGWMLAGSPLATCGLQRPKLLPLLLSTGPHRAAQGRCAPGRAGSRARLWPGRNRVTATGAETHAAVCAAHWRIGAAR